MQEEYEERQDLSDGPRTSLEPDSSPELSVPERFIKFVLDHTKEPSKDDIPRYIIGAGHYKLDFPDSLVPVNTVDFFVTQDSAEVEEDEPNRLFTGYEIVLLFDTEVLYTINYCIDPSFDEPFSIDVGERGVANFEESTGAFANRLMRQLADLESHGHLAPVDESPKV